MCMGVWVSLCVCVCKRFCVHIKLTKYSLVETMLLSVCSSSKPGLTGYNNIWQIYYRMLYVALWRNIDQNSDVSPFISAVTSRMRRIAIMLLWCCSSAPPTQIYTRRRWRRWRFQASQRDGVMRAQTSIRLRTPWIPGWRAGTRCTGVLAVSTLTVDTTTLAPRRSTCTFGGWRL